MLEIRNIRTGSIENTEIQELYESAFPEIERYPYEDILKSCDSGRTHLVGYYDNNKFVGFTFSFNYENFTYLFYIAVKDELRSKGYGSLIIKELVKQNPGKQIIVDIEPVVEYADNYKQRLRRELFYKNLGFDNTDVKIEDSTGVFDIYSTNKEEFKSQEFKKSWSIFPIAFEETIIHNRVII